MLRTFVLKNSLNRVFNLNHFHTTTWLKAEVIKELSCAIDPYASIKVKSSVNLKILPIDYLSRTEARLLCSKTSENDYTIKDFTFRLSNGEATVIKNRDSGNNVECILEIPPTCNVNVEVDGNLDVSSFLNEEFFIKATGNINTNNIKSHKVDIKSKNGNIESAGLLLGQKIEIATSANGKISLMRIIGEEANISSDAGDISAKFAMVEKLSFVTKTGSLDLKNINRKCKVDILKRGDLKMTGVTAQLNANIKSGNIYLQLTEIHGDSTMIVEDSKHNEIYIDDWVQSNVYLYADSDEIIIEDELLEKSQNSNTPSKTFELGDKTSENKFLIKTKGVIKLGKKSWADNALLMFNK